ncbi:MAG: AI-2E family transporter [Bacteroidota bacterium]
MKRIEHAFFLTLLVITTLAFGGLVQSFLQPLFWAAVLATLFHGVQQRYLDRLGGRANLAALLTLLTIVVIVIGPLLVIGMAAARESIAIYERVASGDINVQGLVDRVEGWMPTIAAYAERVGTDLNQLRQNLSEAAVTASQAIASQALNIGQEALRFTVLLGLMLYILYFFLRDGKKMVDMLIQTLPLGDDREHRLLGKFAEVSRATIKGTLVVGVVQGSLGGLAFWLLGISGPVFWGVIMTVLSFLPAVGSARVWGPAAIILIATGEVVQGVILIGVGALLIGLVDNILRPILVGRDTQMPDFLILLATLGGITVFGISGFVIGPIIAAFFLAIWQMFQEIYVTDGPTGVDKERLTRPEAPLPSPEPARSSTDSVPLPAEAPPLTPIPPLPPSA